MTQPTMNIHLTTDRNPNFKIITNFDIDPSDFDIGSFAFGVNSCHTKVCQQKGLLC